MLATSTCWTRVYSWQDEVQRGGREGALQGAIGGGGSAPGRDGIFSEYVNSPLASIGKMPHKIKRVENCPIHNHVDSWARYTVQYTTTPFGCITCIQ